jgi:NAD(P)-dependent dehydrogenase (short-subunit alcohol dehydrogenase family)
MPLSGGAHRPTLVGKRVLVTGAAHRIGRALAMAAAPDILKIVPAQRWGILDEVGNALVFLLDGPEYVTGEGLHVDGGRHLL